MLVKSTLLTQQKDTWHIEDTLAHADRHEYHNANKTLATAQLDHQPIASTFEHLMPSFVMQPWNAHSTNCGTQMPTTAQRVACSMQLVHTSAGVAVC